jgi:hypothetical protein
MNNVKAQVVEGKLHLVIDLAHKPTPSKTGKMNLLASSGGFKELLLPEGSSVGTVKVSLNVGV